MSFPLSNLILITSSCQVTRSIGDDDLKPAVTANPEIIVTCISADDDFLVSFGWLLSYEF